MHEEVEREIVWGISEMLDERNHKKSFVWQGIHTESNHKRTSICASHLKGAKMVNSATDQHRLILQN